MCNTKLTVPARPMSNTKTVRTTDVLGSADGRLLYAVTLFSD